MSSRSRLLEILPGAFIGGIERYGLTIAQAAAASGWAVHAALPPTEANAELVSTFRGAGIATHALDHRGSGPAPWQVVRAAGRTMRVVRRARPSVVHVNVPLLGFGLGHLIGCWLCRVSTVVVFHSLPPDPFVGGRSRALYPKLRASAHAWVAVSEHVQRATAGSLGLAPELITVIPNGVAPASGTGIAKDEETEVRRELGVPDSAFLALSVGRLDRGKGHGDLIRAAVRAAGEFPHMHFVIAGEGAERDRLAQLIKDYGLEPTVHLVGQRTDVPRLLEAADIFVFPSYVEGSPLALLEAAAHGLPIICAEFLGSKDVITHRESGLLHEPGDSDALWRWIQFALEHPDQMQAMGVRAKETASRFSEEEMVSATLALLAEATPSRRIAT